MIGSDHIKCNKRQKLQVSRRGLGFAVGRWLVGRIAGCSWWIYEYSLEILVSSIQAYALCIPYGKISRRARKSQIHCHIPSNWVLMEVFVVSLYDVSVICSGEWFTDWPGRFATTCSRGILLWGKGKTEMRTFSSVLRGRYGKVQDTAIFTYNGVIFKMKEQVIFRRETGDKVK